MAEGTRQGWPMTWGVERMSAYLWWRRAERKPGHIVFSAPYIEARRGSVEALALAPVAVVPERQGQGVGSALTDQRAA
ncbi:MAG: hypothetical protein M3122_02305 [Actinomycetota bacterium]|nr:hypothetical protein [Actinomycetota bacterium]